MRRSTLALVLLAACAPDAPGGEDALTELPVLALSEPTLEIGVLEGDERYTFAAIESVVRLDDGTIAVSDGGASRIFLYDRSGSFVRAWGSRGEGPGEFQSLSRLYRGGPDSLMAADRNTRRISVFDVVGDLGRQVDAVELSGDSLFHLDSWLYGRFWVDGALREEDRARVRALLDALPPPRSSPGYRSVRVTRSGGLWIQEPTDPGAVRLWTRTDPEGDPVGLVQTPARFEPTDISGDEVLGRWTGESDVHFVRAYGLAETGETRATPSWLFGADTTAAALPPPDEEELLASIRAAIRAMATAQEIHYASSFTYTTVADSLSFEQPEGIEVTFTRGDQRGWAAVFAHAGVDRLCGLAYGFNIPPGWTPGAVVCAP